jgi:hypothetical protein
MDNRSSVNSSASRRVLLLGPGELPDATQRALHAAAAWAGLFGFLFILVLDTVATILVFGRSPLDSFYTATRTIVTVGPDQTVDRGPGWIKAFSAVSMLTAVAFTALFTAGVVERPLDRRLTTVVGPRAVPRKGHVVVVGLGEVGLRLSCGRKTTGFPWSSVRPAATCSSSGFPSTAPERWPR